VRPSRSALTISPSFRDPLLAAIQIEFSTIPPYLCAQWSINSNNNGDSSDVNGMIQGVVVQEMMHLAWRARCIPLREDRSTARLPRRTLYPSIRLTGCPKAEADALGR
jgi:hypothetical protein